MARGGVALSVGAVQHRSAKHAGPDTQGRNHKKNKVNKPPKLDSKSPRGLDPELAQLQKWIHVFNIFQMVPSEVITKGVCPVTTPGATPRGGQFPLLKMKGPGVLWFTEGTVRDLEDEEEK